MSKIRRKVTVEGDKSSDEEGGSKRSKLSVFERLGAAKKSFENDDRCRNWVKHGTCPYGPTCRFTHGHSKRKGEGESDEEGKHRKHRSEKHRSKRSQSQSPKRGEVRGHNRHDRKDKDGKMKSAIVVKKRLGRGGDIEGDSDSPPWEGEEGTFEDLDYKDELQLEQKRQEIQRVLQQLAPSEEERDNITIEKKVSSSSDSSSSSGSSSGSSSSSSSSPSPSPPRKQKTRRQKNVEPNRSPSGHRGGRSPPHANRPSPSQQGRIRSPAGRSAVPPEHARWSHRERGQEARERTAPQVDMSPSAQRERAARREITPNPHDRSRESSPSRPASPWNAGESWSPEKPGHVGKGAKSGLRKKRMERQEKKTKLRGPRTPSPNAEWEGGNRAREKNRDIEIERERTGHREKLKKKHRLPLVQEKVRRKGHSQSPPPVERSKGRRTPSPEFDRKRPDVPMRHDTETDNDSPAPRSSRRSPSPGRDKLKKVKRRGRALSVSPLRTKKLSPGPTKGRDFGQDQRKERYRDGSFEHFRQQEMTPERESKDKPRGRSPGQAHQKHKKRKDISAEKKKKHHGSQELMSPVKHSRKRSLESPVTMVTPVKLSRRKSAEKGQQVSPMKRLSRSKSGKRKDRKGSKGMGDWEPTPPKSEEKIRSRGDVDSSRARQSSPEPSLSRSRDNRRTPPPDLFDPRSRGSDPRRPGTPPQHRPESPEGFRHSGPGSPPHFSRGSRDDPNFPSGHRRREEEFGRPPPGSASPPGGRRGRDARYRDDFDGGHGRREPHSDIPGRMDRFNDPRNRDRGGRFQEIRPLFDERSGSRMDPDRQMFEMERARFEREADERIRGREGFERERFGRERFSGRSDRFDNGRGGREPRPLVPGGPPPWEREFGRPEEGRGVPGDRFPPGRGFEEGLPDRRRGDWENRRPDFREEWNSRKRGDERRDLGPGRRGDFMESRDGRRFEEPRMLRGMEREEMLRVRLDGDFRDRRELPDLRDLPFPDIRGRDDRRDNKMDERRDDRRDDRRREDRDGDRKPDRRDDSRKRVHDGEDDRGRSPPVKRQREMSPGGSLRSHHSNLEEARAADMERERERRRERSQDDGRRDVDSEGRRSRRSEDPRFKDLDTSRGAEGIADIGRDGDNSMRSSHERDKSNDRDSNRKRDDPGRSGMQERSIGDKDLGERKIEKFGDKDSEDGRGVRQRSLPRDTHDIPEREADRESVRSGRSGRESRRGRTSSQGRDSQSSKGRIRDFDRDSIGERDKDKGSPHSRSDQRLSRGGTGERGCHGEGDSLGEEQDRDKRDRQSITHKLEEGGAKSREHDRDTLSEKDWRREQGRGLSKERDSHSEKGYSDYRRRSRDREDLRRSKSIERTLKDSTNFEAGDQVEKVKEEISPDSISETGSTSVSMKKEPLIHKDNQTDLSTLKGESKITETPHKATVKTEGGDMYDPFDAESDHRESQERIFNKDDQHKEGDKVSESGRSKRRLSTGSQGEDGQAKRQRMIEISEGTLTETTHPDKRHIGEGDGRLPFSGDKEERCSQAGDVYSDWSSADDAEDILRRTDALPFSNSSRNGEAENGDSQPLRSNLDRMRRSPSRSSHGSRRERSRDDRGREMSRDDRLRDDRSRTSRPSSRHSSYDRYRDDRRRFELADRERVQTSIVDGKPEERGDQSTTTTMEPGVENLDMDEKEELSMDYETISVEGDIGSDEDNDSKGVVSALQLDWSSLTRDERPSTAKSSTLQRFKPAHVFQRIGIEKAYAGATLFEKVKTFCQKQLDEEASDEAGAPLEEEQEADNDMKEEEEEKKDKPAFTLHHNIAAFHATAILKLTERSKLFRNIGTYRRALCARRDLDIRRQLCRLDKVRFDS